MLNQVNITNKQPNQLYFLSLLELGERFSHYLLRAIIVLYMVKVLLFTNRHAYGVFAGFSALLYLSSLFGGYVADRYLGPSKSIIIGGVLLSLGYFLLGISTREIFIYPALSLLIIGGGFFMPNIISLVGQLYTPNDLRREGGFSIFYASINVGALLSPLLIPFIIAKHGWHAGFFLAMFSATICTGTFLLSLSSKNSILLKTSDKNTPNLTNCIQLFIAISLLVIFFSKLLQHPHISTAVVFVLGSGFLYYTLQKTLVLDNEKRNSLRACLYLVIFSIVFEILFQQSAMSMTMFVENHVHRHIANWEIPTIMSQALNPLFIILLAPIFSSLWVSLSNKNLNPSVAVKFACGTLLAGIGFAIFPLAIYQSEVSHIHYGWIILSYMLQSIGELLVSPIGLSMITEKSPPQITGEMIGVWYFSMAIGQALAGLVSQLTIVTSYSETFGLAGILAILTGLLLLLLAPKFNRLLSSA